MADDVTFTVAADATPPGGTVAATDETTSGPHSAGAQMGIAKLAVSANGDSTHVPATAADGLLVNLGANNDVTITSGAVTTGGLTDAELRASPVDVDGSGVTQPVSNAGLTALNGAIAGTEVQADIVGALPAGNNNIGDVDIASLPNEGQQTMANSISVAIASNQTAVPISGTVTATGGLTDAELRATPVPVSGTVTANAGTNLNTSALALEAGGNLAAAAASLATLDNIVAGSEAQVDVVGALPAGNNNIGDVDVLTLPAIPAGTNNIGDVDVLTMPVTEVVGDVAADAAVPANPLATGGRASTALPTAVSADGDSVYQWLLRSGAAMTAQLPHLGLLGDPYSITAVTAQYTTAQTSTVLINPGASQRIAVTYIQIQVGGTVGGTLQVYFGTGAYSRGTSLAIFDGEFLPSATLKPGFTASPAKPWISAAADDDLRVTNTGTINPLTITVWYYFI